MTDKPLTRKQWWRRIFYFFPLQLFVYQLKHNYWLLFFWFILTLLLTESIGSNYGVPYLLLYPEYLGEVDFLSHFILGFSFGGFYIAYNISSYVSNGYKFPFIATLSQPFFKYSLNNFVFPFSLFILFVYKLFDFQLYYELLDIDSVLFNVSGFLFGFIFFIAIGYLYFFNTNKDSEYITNKENSIEKSPIHNLLHKSDSWSNYFKKTGRWRIETYLSGFTKISLARTSKHYDVEVLHKVFKQNHINASYFEIITILSLFLIGQFREYELFAIPAGASILLGFTIFLMLISALNSWLRAWTSVVLILAVLIINVFSIYTKFKFKNSAYGLDYSIKKEYSNNSITELTDSTLFKKSIRKGIETLEQWKRKQNSKKPYIIFLNSSGGGLRSALWTTECLLYLDSVFKEDFLEKVHLITGASGGILGASLYREFKQNKNQKISSNELAEKVSEDLLNPIALTIAVSDIFPRFQSFSIGNNSYIKDRGYAFEKQLIQNTDSILFKTLDDYKIPEQESQIPTIIYSPVIVNDGRRLLISSSDIAYLTPPNEISSKWQDVEFQKLFADNNPGNMWITSAIRMSATFPYVLPNVSMPTVPSIQVMDAGIEDNFGFHTTEKFIRTFKPWLEENTAGIIILQLLDKQKEINVRQNPVRSFLQTLISPLGGFYSNWLNTQILEQESSIKTLKDSYDGEIHHLKLELRQSSENKVSISFHLTQKEKNFIVESVDKLKQSEDFNKLLFLLNNKSLSN